MVFLIAIVIYITIRFEFRMALATIGALIHDILVGHRRLRHPPARR